MDQAGVLHCEICDAALPNFESMRWHIKGKRHQNSLVHWKRKSADAKLSIFVRNFPMATSEQEMWQYFAQFGRVTKVSIVTNKNNFAIIEFGSADAVQKVLQQDSHRLNSQHLIVKARTVEIPGKPSTNQFQQGYNQGFHRASSDLSMRQVYGQGGRGAGPSWAGDGAMAPHGRKRVTIDDQLDQYYHEELMEKLIRVRGVQNQLEWLCQNLQVTAEEAQTKFYLCEKLQNCLGQFFPGCTVNQFGSSVNGFGLSGCDMDIFLDLRCMHSRTWELQPIKLPYVKDFKFLKEKEWGPLIPADVNRMGIGDQCKLINRILTELLDGYREPQVVPSNRCPIVRFKYASEGSHSGEVKCDLSVNNQMALQNTKLLYLYSVLNSRVRLLVYAIRYWAKVKGISGNNKASTKLSNYALTLMVLNYLQRLDPPVLPTIEKLSQIHGPTGRMKIEGWDCTFAMDWQTIPQSNNHQTAAELLSGFFSFWSAFNFADNVLMARTAEELPFTEFFEKSTADGRIRCFQASAINIQDPFVLNHNITKNVNEKAKELIEREFRIAAIKTSVWGNDGFAMSEGGGDLIHLLNDEVPDIILLEEQEKREADANDPPGHMKPTGKTQFTFDIELKPTMMTSKLLKQLQKTGNFRVGWCNKICNFILRTLKETLLLVVEELPEATPEVKEKLANEEIKRKALKKHNDDVSARMRQRLTDKQESLKAKRREEMQQIKQQMYANQSTEAAEHGDQSTEAADQSNNDGHQSTMEDVQAGAIAGAKRPSPMSLFDLDLSVPKRFRGTGLDLDLELEESLEVSDDDDKEELIDFKPEIPDMKYKRESNAEVNFQYFMRAWCMTWARRKKVKNYLVNEEGRKEEDFMMEKLISETIYQNDGAPLPRPVVGFYCYLESHIQGNETKVTVEMECKEGKLDFSTFFLFFKVYVTKLINKHLHG